MKRKVFNAASGCLIGLALVASETEASSIPNHYRADVEENLTQIIETGSLNERALMTLSLGNKLIQGIVAEEFQCSVSNVVSLKAREISGKILEEETPNMTLVASLLDTSKKAEAFSYINNCQKIAIGVK